MRFLLSRIFKNFPYINSLWLSYLGKSDFDFYSKHCKNYKIVPFGNYCLPRVITTINRFKPTRKYGEESYPFDLCFSNFSLNVELLSTNFNNFFDDITFDKEKNYWINNKTGMIFNHDSLTQKEFVKRYKNRIKNLYKVLDNQSIHIYFIVATFEIISVEDVDLFIKVINRYRTNETFDLIIINQTNKFQAYNNKNVYSINLKHDKSFKKINKISDWVGELKKMKTFDARYFNHKIISKLSKIIKQ